MNRIEIEGSISARQQPVGGDVSQNPVSAPKDWHVGKSTVVFLLHGFNVNQSEADDSYEAFISLLPSRLNGVFGAGYWPGDSAWFSAIRYPFKIKTAISSGERFSRLVHRLKRLSPMTRIIIVAHSLGCRVTLELMNELNSMPVGPTAQIDLIYLMAAAVPVGHLAPNGMLEPSKRIASRRIAFHSSGDKILKGAFRLGEPIAWVIGGETGLHFQAAGIDGEPADYWTATKNSLPNDHGDYWKDARIVRKLALELGAALPNVPAEYHPYERSATEARSTPRHAIHRRASNPRR